ncbi:hypothetical protein [Lysobacter gummosus]|uniref:hypothetical protein n=1 Tax=Lysobacter gummosus TaxID=262324 RepID=UPI00363874B8
MRKQKPGFGRAFVCARVLSGAGARRERAHPCPRGDAGGGCGTGAAVRHAAHDWREV